MKTTTRTKDSNVVVSKRNTPTPRFFMVASIVWFASVALATLGMLITLTSMFG